MNILPILNTSLIVLIFLIAINNFAYLHKHRDDKNKIKNEDFGMYPLVEPEFYQKTITRQTVENNQEIQEINERLRVIEEKLGIN